MATAAPRTAAAMAASAAKAVKATLTPTAAVRQVLAKEGNQPQRMAVLWARVSAQLQAAGTTPISKTAFKQHIVQAMFKRGEMTKLLLQEEVKGKSRSFYGLRLRNVRMVRNRVELPRSGARTRTQTTAPAPAPPQTLQ